MVKRTATTSLSEWCITDTLPCMRYVAGGLVVIIALFMWSPWLTEHRVIRTIMRDFEISQQSKTDGCDLLSVRNVQRTLFGFSADILYACGIVQPGGDIGEWHTAHMDLFGITRGDFNK